MYVLCTLVVLSIHSLFKSRHKALEPGDKEAGDGATLPGDKAPPLGEGGRVRDPGPGGLGGGVGPRERGVTVALSQEKRQRAVDRKAAGCNCTNKRIGDRELRCSQGRLGCGGGSLENVPDSRKRLQVRGGEDGDRGCLRKEQRGRAC